MRFRGFIIILRYQHIITSHLSEVRWCDNVDAMCTWTLDLPIWLPRVGVWLIDRKQQGKYLFIIIIVFTVLY